MITIDTPKIRGRKRAITRSVSMQIARAAINQAGGSYALSRFIDASFSHLARCQTGENGMSLPLAKALIKYLGVPGRKFRAAITAGMKEKTL